MLGPTPSKGMKPYLKILLQHLQVLFPAHAMHQLTVYRYLLTITVIYSTPSRYGRLPVHWLAQSSEGGT